MNTSNKNKLNTNTKRNATELYESILQQAKLLKDFCLQYDHGNIDYAAEIALKLRVWFHSGKYGDSLFNQAISEFDIKKPLFPDSRGIPTLNMPTEGNSMLSSYIIQYELNYDIHKILTPVPKFVEDYKYKYFSFLDWWSKATILCWKENYVKRKDVVLLLANKDGGAHVDSDLGKRLFELKRQLIKTPEFNVDWGNGDHNEYETYHVDTTKLLHAAIRTIANEALIVIENSILPSVNKAYKKMQS